MRKLILSLLVVASTSVFAFASAFAAEEYPRGKLPAGVTPLSYRLDLTIVPEQARFSGHAEIDIDLKEPAQSIYLHGRELKMTSAVAIHGKERSTAKYTELDNLGTARLDDAMTRSLQSSIGAAGGRPALLPPAFSGFVSTGGAGGRPV